MFTNTSPVKTSELANKVIDKIMVATGFISLVWILAFLLVAMIDK
jgi:hypothetical protein